MTKFVIIGAYALLMVAIGFASMKKADTLTNFMVGGRQAGPWLSGFAYGTTYFSAVLFIGYAGRNGWDFGIWAVLIGIGNAILGTYLPWKVLAERTRMITTTYKIKTMPGFFEKRYDSKAMKIFAAIIIFIFMAPYSASVYSGISYFCETVLGLDYIFCMAIIAVLTSIYLVLGGYVATLIADLVQGFIMIGGVILMVRTISAAPQIGGFFNAFGLVGEVTSQSVHLFDFAGPVNIWSLIALIFLTSFGTWALPQTVHKFYAVKDKATIRPATIISTLFAMLISCGAYFTGSLSRLFFDEIPKLNGQANYDMIIPTLLAEYLPEILLSVIFVLVLSASMSTLSSLVLASASAISMDIVQDNLKPDMPKDKTLLLTRVLCLLFIALSFVIAATRTPILMLMSFSWGTVAGSFMGPFILGLYDKKTTKAGAWAGMIGGFSLSIILCVGSGFNAGYASIFGMCAMLFSLIATFVVSRMTSQYDKAFVEQFFIKESAEK